MARLRVKDWRNFILLNKGIPLQYWSIIIALQSESSFRLHSLCVLRGGGGGILGGDLKIFGKGQGGFTKIFDRRKGGLLICFSPFIKIRKHCFVDFFFIKEDYVNYSMFKESLLAYLLDKYTLYRTLTINITFKCFYCKAI